MNGTLIAQQFSGDTFVITLAADGLSVLNNATLPVNLPSLDILAGPGGVLFGIDFIGNALRLGKHAGYFHLRGVVINILAAMLLPVPAPASRLPRPMMSSI